MKVKEVRGKAREEERWKGCVKRQRITREQENK